MRLGPQRRRAARAAGRAAEGPGAAVAGDLDRRHPRDRARAATKPGSTKGRFWVYIGDAEHPYSVYDFTMSRARDGPAAFLRGLSRFPPGRCLWGLRRDLPRLRRDGSWKWPAGRTRGGSSTTARSNAPREANQVLEWIRQLYDIEDRARDFTPEERQALRQRESVPILDRIEKYLDELSRRVLPKSALGQGDDLRAEPVGGVAAVHERRPADDRQQRLGADAAAPGHRPEELGVPRECGGGPASGGAVHDPGGGEASSPGAVGVCSGRAAAVERGRDGPGGVAAGPVGGEPSGARAAAPPGRVAAAKAARQKESTAEASCKPLTSRRDDHRHRGRTS